jgi:prepilin-type N-terminal cleavage/methylation domain-containing protein
MEEHKLQGNPTPRFTPRGAWSFYPAGERKGFTLIELIIATAISALVMGILSVCFSFALRVWQSTQDSKPDFAFPVAELLKSQLAECDPTPIRFTETLHPVFIGKPNSIAFITTHSVRAISQGVPVVVRYTYDPNSKILYYSELLLDPYHSKSIEQFLADKSLQNKDSKIHSYGVEFPEFVLEYAGEESKQFSQSWDSKDEFPKEVLMRWRGQDTMVHTQILMLNTPFSIVVPKVQLPNVAPGGAAIR